MKLTPDASLIVPWGPLSCHRCDVGFRLVIGPGVPDEEFDDDASFTFNPHGMLVIESGDERITFAPGGWQRLVTPIHGGKITIRPKRGST